MNSDSLHNINTVQEWFKWRGDSKSLSVEKHNKKEVLDLGWENTDVLYSFLGVYVIGAWVFYPEQFVRTPCRLNRVDGKTAYSYDFLHCKYSNYNELNDLQELKNFLNKYFSIGNICPIWPGGNAHMGISSQCFDIPDIYFKRHEKWTSCLIKVYPQAYLDSIIDSKNKFCADGDTRKFLDIMNDNNKEGRTKVYVNFLNHITNIICKREQLLLNKN